MKASFYKSTAFMVGVDLHHAQTIFIESPSEAVKGHTLAPYPYGVHGAHCFDCKDEKKRTETVSAEACDMILDGFVITKVLHIPLPLPIFHPYELVEAGKIKDASSSTPFLKMATVTSEGGPLSVCGAGPIGGNLNCQEEGTKLTGIVYCPCSVVTRPQLRALLFRFFDDFKKQYLEGLLDLVDWLLEKKLKIPDRPRAIVKWLLRKIVTKLVDWLEKLLREFLEEQERKERERRRAPAWPPWPLNRPLTPQEEEELRRWNDARLKALPGWDPAPPF